MPPALSDEDTASSGAEEISVPAQKKKQPKEVEVEDQDEDEEDSDEEYIVEKITDHAEGKRGVILYHVKWQGYDEPSDMTWETEENLAGVEALEDYFKKLGEKPVWGKQSSAAVKKRKGRQSSSKAEPSPEPVKRMKKAKEWAPPQGSWEDEIEFVDTVEQRLDPKTGQLAKYGYLRWKNGIQTTHPLPLIYKKLPQKMLLYYEQHLVFNDPEMEVESHNVDMSGIEDDDL